MNKTQAQAVIDNAMTDINNAHTLEDMQALEAIFIQKWMDAEESDAPVYRTAHGLVRSFIHKMTAEEDIRKANELIDMAEQDIAKALIKYTHPDA